MNTIFYKTKQKAASIVFALVTVFALVGIQTASAQMPGGTYTIDANSSASTTNFRNFISFSNALRNISRTDGGPLYGAAGISGAITVNVVANSGPYTERVEFFQVTNASSTNTISINGNSNTIQFDATSTTTASIMFLNGADWFRIRNLRFRTINVNQGHGIRLANAADNNIIENNVFDISSVSSTGTANSSGIRLSSSETSNTDYTSSGVKGVNNQIIGNEIFGSTSNNGLYCGIVIQGSSSTAQQHNTLIKNNIIRNFYLYGVYDYYYHNGITYEGNTIYRGVKPTQTTYYGIYSFFSTNKVFDGNWIYDGAPTTSNFTFQAFGIYDYYGTTSNMGTHKYHNNVVAFTNGGYRYGIYGLTYYTTGMDYYHNTIYYRHHATGNYIQGYGFYTFHYEYRDLNFFNNIIDIEGTDIRATTYGRYFYNYGRINSDNNIQHKNTNSGSYQYHYRYSLTNGGTGNYNDLAALKAAGFDLNSKDVKPTYRDTVPTSAGIMNLIPTSIDIDGSGRVISAVTRDRDGNTRSTTAPDPGAYEFDMPINVSAITHPNAMCQNNQSDVQVTITNNATIALRNFSVQFSINGVVQATEVYTSTIQPNTSANYTFTQKLNNATIGSFVLTANVRGKAAVVSKNYSVNASPIGSVITQGSVFQGKFNAGDAQDPDIVAYGDNVRYSITPPTSYNNNQYNSTWVFDYWDLRSTNNVDAGATHTKTNPSSNNAVSSFTPVIAQSDETFILRYAIRSLTNGCVAPEVSRRIFVAPRPVASFTANAVCEGDAMQFNNTSTISTGNNTYKWEFGTGDETNLIDPTYTYPAAGTYSVKLTATSNYGYTHTVTQNVTVNPNPTADFIWNNECEGTAIQFTDASVIPGGTPSYSWTFGDGTTSTANSPAKTYVQVGTYPVTMKVTSLGCTGTATGYATLKPMPMASFISSPAVCNSEKISFTNNSSISNGSVGYNWNFGDNTFTSAYSSC
jgi:PKD repeat protein